MNLRKYYTDEEIQFAKDIKNLLRESKDKLLDTCEAMCKISECPIEAFITYTHILQVALEKWRLGGKIERYEIFLSYIDIYHEGYLARIELQEEEIEELTKTFYKVNHYD